MKNLVRNSKGDFVIEDLRSPIVTSTNSPKSLPAEQTLPSKEASSDLFTKLTPEILLEEMRKAGGKNLVTEQFAILITTKVKKSVDEAKHHLWDLALAHVRTLMRRLEVQGKVTMTPSFTSGKLHYLYSVVEPKEEKTIFKVLEIEENATI